MECLEWQMTWGKSIKALEQAKAQGITPPALLNKPKTTQWSEDYWYAFNQLSGSRSYTMGGPAPIPYDVIICWLDNNLIINIDDREDYIYVIQQLDELFIQKVSQKGTT